MRRRVGSRARTAQDQQVHGGLADAGCKVGRGREIRMSLKGCSRACCTGGSPMQGAERGRWQLLGYHMLEKGGTSARAVDGSMCVASLHGASQAEADSGRLVDGTDAPRKC